MNFALLNATSTGLLPQVLVSKVSLKAPDAAAQHCIATLTKSGVLSKVDYAKHAFAWGTDPAFAGLAPKQAEAVFVLCVAESLKVVPAGATQKVIDDLAQQARAKVLATKAKQVAAAAPNTAPWLLALLGVTVVGGGIYMATRKRRR